MKRIIHVLCFLAGSALFVGADGCSSDPNVEGAKLDLRNKDLDRALENVAQALERDSANAEAHLLKGQILQELLLEESDSEDRQAFVIEMKGAFARSVELDSTGAGETRRRMQAAYTQEFYHGIEVYNDAQYVDDGVKWETYKRAAGHFRMASLIFPDSTGAYFNEASAYISGGMATRAIAPFEMALQMGSTSRRIFLFLGTIYNQAAEAESDITLKHRAYERLVYTLEPALELYPQDDELRSMLLNAYSLAGQEDKALAYYEAEVADGNTNKVFLYNYGTLLLRLNEYDEAIAQLTAATRIDSLYSNARFNLGAAYVNKAVAVGAEYSALDDSLDVEGSRTRARVGEELADLHSERRVLFGEAITNLEVARSLTEAEMGSVQNICRALYQAYGWMNERSKAEEVQVCAEL